MLVKGFLIFTKKYWLIGQFQYLSLLSSLLLHFFLRNKVGPDNTFIDDVQLIKSPSLIFPLFNQNCNLQHMTEVISSWSDRVAHMLTLSVLTMTQIWCTTLLTNVLLRTSFTSKYRINMYWLTFIVTEILVTVIKKKRWY